MLVFLVAMLLVICGWLASVVISQRQRLDAAEESAQVERTIVRAAV